MPITTYNSTEKTPESVLADIRRQAAGTEARLVLYFASSCFDQQALAAGMQELFAPADVMGCSTAGEIISGAMLTDSVVVMALGSDIIADVKIEVLEGIGASDPVPQAFANFEQACGTPMATMDIERYVGLILADGLSGREEALMDRIGDLTNVNFIGGSAGDDLAFKATYVCTGGRAYRDAAVLALLEPKVNFDIIKTQSFNVLPQTLTATKVDEASRTVIDFDGQPAAQAYAAALGITAEELEDHFMSNPLGLMAGDEPFVRSPQKLVGDAVVFYCQILEGMQLSLLQSTDIVTDTGRALAARPGDIAGLIDFHCILRTLELRKKGQTEAYGRLLADVPAIGFSTYGEEFLGHINQTSTMLVFLQA